MNLRIETSEPARVRSAIPLTVPAILALVSDELAEQGDEFGLPEGATLFLVTETIDESGDKSVKRVAVNPNNGNGVSMHLEIPFYQNSTGRTAIGGRPRKEKKVD
jgi:hypothetical protein